VEGVNGRLRIWREPVRPRAGAVIVLDEDELRWLAFAVGPALLSTPAEQAV